MRAEENYWTQALRKRLSRRQALRLAALGGLSTTLPGILGCQPGNQPSAPTPTSQVSTSQSGTVSATATATPKLGGNLRWHSTELTTWDPHRTITYITHQVMSFMYNRLVTFAFDDPQYTIGAMKVQPDLAEKWDISPDLLTYTFYLRHGVKWDSRPPTNGRELVAQDVKYSYERYLASKFTNLTYFDKIARIETPDNYTVKFVLKQPYSPFLSHMALGYQWILPKEVEDQYGDFTKPEVHRGTGPWILDKFEPDTRKVFKKNPNYYRKDIPYVDTVEIKMIRDASTQLSAMRSDQLDILSNVAPASVASLKSTNSNLQWHVDKQNVNAIALGFRLDQQTPFVDKRVRQAISMSLDRKGFVDTYLGGQGILTNGPVRTSTPDYYLPPEQMGDAAKYIQYNPQEAKSLLAAAGFPNGFKTPMNTLKGTWAGAFDDEAEWVVSSLAKVGIQVEMKLGEYASFLQTAYRGDYDSMLFVPVAAAAGIEEAVALLYYPGAGRNQSHTNDPVITKYIEDFWKAPDLAAQKKVLADFQKYETEQQNRVFVPMPWVYTAFGSTTRNFMESYGMDQGQTYARVWFDK